MHFATPAEAIQRLGGTEAKGTRGLERLRESRSSNKQLIEQQKESQSGSKRDTTFGQNVSKSEPEQLKSDPRVALGCAWGFLG